MNIYCRWYLFIINLSVSVNQTLHSNKKNCNLIRYTAEKIEGKHKQFWQKKVHWQIYCYKNYDINLLH